MKKTYQMTWRNKFLTIDAKSLDDMLAQYDTVAKTFRAMKETGKVWLVDNGAVCDDYATLETDDPEIAKRFGFEEEEDEEETYKKHKGHAVLRRRATIKHK